MNLNRLESLIGREKLNEIINLKILIIGVGGVGGYVLESLVRSGVGNITVIDPDIIDESNLNRQILTNSENVGLNKVDEAVKRAKMINKDININGIKDKISAENIHDYVKGYDYVVDACDDVSAKINLIKYSYKNNIKLISCMGTGKKIDALKLEVTTLDKTSYCPLAKKVRKELSREEGESVKVIYSTEEAISSEILGSTSYVPGIAGLMITGEIIKEIIKKE